MYFLIQTYQDQIVWDFCFHMVEAVKYNNWLQNKEVMGYDKYESLDELSGWRQEKWGYCPIGTVEFVTSFYKKYYNLTPKPRNVPKELFPYAAREIFNGTEKDIKGKMFVKSNDTIKGFVDECTEAPAGNYQISSLINIQSEWRVFVYKGKLVGLKHYLGRFDLFPDVEVINALMIEFTTAPIAYTLDVCISEIAKGRYATLPLEVHDFFSCGLYGFADYRILPQMHYDWFKEYTQEASCVVEEREKKIENGLNPQSIAFINSYVDKQEKEKLRKDRLMKEAEEHPKKGQCWECKFHINHDCHCPYFPDIPCKFEQKVEEGAKELTLTDFTNATVSDEDMDRIMRNRAKVLGDLVDRSVEEGEKK